MAKRESGTYKAVDKGFSEIEKFLADMDFSRHDATIDARMKIEVAEEGLEAYLVITPSQAGGRMVGLGDVIGAAKGAGLRSVDEQAVAEAISKKRFNTPILIARGIPPRQGRRADLILQVKDDELVGCGQILVTKRKPGYGVPGVSVRGERIPGLLGEDVELAVGENVRLSEDGARAYAEIDGVIIWDGKRIGVKEIPRRDTSTDGLELFMDQIKKAAHDPSLDARIKVLKERDKAYIVITPHKPGGRMLEKEDILRTLQSEEIYIDEGLIETTLAKREFNTPVLIAQSISPTRGKDGLVIYKVKQDQRVKEGQLLAVKEKATPGIPGMTLSGKAIPAEDGKDVDLLIGENVRLSGNGLKAYATIDGVLVLKGKRIMVREPQPIAEPAALSDRDLYQMEEGIDSLLDQTRQRGHDPNLDARIEIEIEKDRFVYLTIIPPQIRGRMLEWDELKDLLAREKIVHPDEAAIRDAIKRRRFNTPILIAQGGTPPVNGEDAKICIMPRRGDRVEKGELLAVKEAPTKGTPGLSIWGREIPAEDGREVEFSLGEDVRVGDDGLKVYAATNGIFYLEGDRVGVIREEEPLFVVEEDDLDTIELIEQAQKQIAHDPTLDARIEVKIEEGDLEACIILIPPRTGGRMVGLDDIRDALQIQGILNFDEIEVTKAIKRERFNIPILVAKGVPPIDGEDAKIIYKTRGGERAKKGEVLAMKEVATRGIPGLSVRGDQIPAKDGSDTCQLLYGENVEIAGDGLSIYAAVDGQVYWDGIKMAIEETGEPIPLRDLEGSEGVIEDLFESIEEMATGRSNVDGTLKIEFRRDGAEAYIIITPPKIGGRPVLLKEIYQRLEEERIRGIDDEAIKRALEEHHFWRPLLVAKGIPATQGEDAFYLYRFGVDENGQDLRRDAITGQLLMVKTTATNGSVGRSVTGEEIPAKLGRELRIIPKRGVTLSEDGTRAYATTNGRVVWRDSTLSVEKVKEIDTDLDTVIGDIDFEGRVSIRGSVAPGISIRATSDVEIGGDVNEAEISTEGSLYVEGHLAKTKVVAKGDVIARSAVETGIEAGGGIVISDQIIDCKIEASGSVVSQGENGQIAGGTIIARGGIDAKAIGQEKRKRTILIVGEDAEIKASTAIYPGVELRIGDHKLGIRRLKERVALSVVGGEIIEGEYEPSRIERSLLSDEQDSGIKTEGLPISVVITDTSLNVAKRIGAELLGLKVEEVEVQEIEEETEKEAFRVFAAGTILPTPEEEQVEREIEWMLAQGEDKNGSYRIISMMEGLFLTVFPAIGSGEPVQEDTVIAEITDNGYKGVDYEEVKRVVEEALATPARIGPRQYNPEIDGSITLEIIDGGRKASMILLPPKKGGIPISFDRVMETLKIEGIVAGIKEEVVREAIKEGRFSTPILVAQEIPPQGGRGSEIEYKFRVDQKIELVEDREGRVDFHELGLVQNVRAGDLLARKRLSIGGTPGRSITGEVIPPPPVQDIRLPAGKNTIISEDGLELRAAIDGRVVFSNERVSVEPVYEVKGDVNLATGNIDFLGTVDILGSVEDGFNVTAGGDIQIRGGVGKSFIQANGTVVVGVGIQGGQEAEIKTGKDLISKFIEGTQVKCRGSVIVSQEILHSLIDAEERIEVLAGRGSIIGGHLRAVEGVVARSIGSKAGTPTLIEVGVRPKFRQQLLNLEGIFEEDYRQLKMVQAEISGLRRLRQEGTLLEDREELLNRLISKQNELSARLRSHTDRREYLEMELLRSTGGKVTVLETLYPGVTITVRTARYVVNEPMTNVTFTFVENRVRVDSVDTI